MPPKHKKLALRLGIQTYQTLTSNDEVCIPSLSNILLAVLDFLTHCLLHITTFLLLFVVHFGLIFDPSSLKDGDVVYGRPTTLLAQ
jgi:hypothetical protein